MNIVYQLIIQFINPITNTEEELIIRPYVLDKMKERFLKHFENDEDLRKILDTILKEELDTSIILSCGKLNTVGTPKYNNSLSLFEFYRQQIIDDIIKTEYIDHLRAQHIRNIIFDTKYKEEHKNDIIKTKTKNTKHRTPKQPLWIKQQSTDLFDGEPMYIYQNTKTGEIIESKDPNYIVNVLTKKKRTKKAKFTFAIPNITISDFSFKMSK